MRKADGKPVENQDLIERIASQLSGRSVTFTWVRGHGGDWLQDKADQLALEAAQGRPGAAEEPSSEPWWHPAPVLGPPMSDEEFEAITASNDLPASTVVPEEQMPAHILIEQLLASVHDGGGGSGAG